MSDQNHQIGQDQKKKLRSVKGFNIRDDIAGMPRKIFISVLILAGFWGGVAIRDKYAVLLWLIVLIVPMRFIHKEDPNGFEVWSRAFFKKHQRWSCAKIGRRKLYLIKKGEGL